MRRGVGEVLVGGQQRHAVSYAELGKQCIDRSELYACTPASISEFGCLNVVLPIRRENGKGLESRDDVSACSGSGKSLEKLLKDQSGGHYKVIAFERGVQRPDLREFEHPIATQGQGPDAGVDE